ncbi:MAG TPA: hypothetical protein VFK38_01255 [Candidatus Limnocylindrales bacterium]|nr:hypothetical protein [Candidatus Limnocylindrales bacterium]
MSVPSQRRPAVAIAALAFVVLNIGLASSLVIAAYGFDLGTFTDVGSLVERGGAAAELLRWGGLIDAVGYLALAPVVLHLQRERPAPVLAAAGLGFSLVGAIGALTLASAGPWLLSGVASGTIQPEIARTAFGALEKAVYVGLWGALGQSLLGTWLIGTSWLMRADSRLFAFLGIGSGLGSLGYALRTGVMGQPPMPITSPLDLAILGGIGLVPVWVTWLAVRLAVGRAVG